MHFFCGFSFLWFFLFLDFHLHEDEHCKFFGFLLDFFKCLLVNVFSSPMLCLKEPNQLLFWVVSNACFFPCTFIFMNMNSKFSGFVFMHFLGFGCTPSGAMSPSDGEMAHHQGACVLVEMSPKVRDISSRTCLMLFFSHSYTSSL